jgi:hypothetical protein
MDYKTLMGYGDKKKKESKPKQNKIVENIKSEINEWNDNTYKTLPKRWSGASDKGLTEFEKQGGKDFIKEGPAFEYKKHAKKINKSLKELQKSYLDFYETLRKKGLDDSAADFLDNYKKNVVGFTKKYKKDFGKLM